jgi:hypothetical protein
VVAPRVAAAPAVRRLRAASAVYGATTGSELRSTVRADLLDVPQRVPQGYWRLDWVRYGNLFARKARLPTDVPTGLCAGGCQRHSDTVADVEASADESWHAAGSWRNYRSAVHGTARHDPSGKWSIPIVEFSCRSPPIIRARSISRARPNWRAEIHLARQFPQNPQLACKAPHCASSVIGSPSRSGHNPNPHRKAMGSRNGARQRATRGCSQVRVPPAYFAPNSDSQSDSQAGGFARTPRTGQHENPLISLCRATQQHAADGRRPNSHAGGPWFESTCDHSVFSSHSTPL